MPAKFSAGGPGFQGPPPQPSAAQMAARRADEEAAAATLQRRLDTRRKVVLGAALLGAAQHDPEARRVLHRLVGALDRPQDKRLFEEEPKT